MHDIDRTQDELEFEDELESREFEEEMENDIEEDDVFEFEDDEQFEDETEMPFKESEEMELAAELLEVQDDEELEYFLGKLFKRGRRKLKKFVRRRGKRFLKRALRRVAKRVIPFAGRAVGGLFGGPVGAALGGRAASRASKIFGLELEGLSPEDQEFEAARRFVRLAGSAADKLDKTPVSIPDESAAKKALVSAAKKHAPGLLGKTPSGIENTGRWVRRGRTIVLMGA